MYPRICIFVYLFVCIFHPSPFQSNLLICPQTSAGELLSDGEVCNAIVFFFLLFSLFLLYLTYVLCCCQFAWSVWPVNNGKFYGILQCFFYYSSQQSKKILISGFYALPTADLYMFYITYSIYIFRHIYIFL